MIENNYLVLARKYRPQKFSDFKGQNEIIQILKGALEYNRLAHAYLLSGTRGVGKTTLARLMAKTVNCLSRKTKEDFEPCGECENCMSINSSSNLDVVEIDAASKTGVSDVREIIENINYKPVSALKKVFIIDEVHMLSKAAFNALLKTLEEPPLDVLFILATTETEKVPVTILSRCQHFILKRFSVNEIKDHLIRISKLEKINLNEESAMLISRASEGSMRDALSLLDNVITRGSNIETNLVREVLCLEDFANVIDLFKNICDGNVKKALQLVDEFYLDGISLELLAKDLLNIIYQITRLKSTETHKDDNLTDYELSEYQNLSKLLGMDVLIRMYEFMEKYFAELVNSFDQKKSFEMTIMRLCYVILIPSPFDYEAYSATKKTITSLSEQDSAQNQKNFVEKKLALNNEDNLSNAKIPNKSFKAKTKIERFRNLVSMIESEGHLIFAHKLRNNFRLVSIKDDEKVKPCELELDNFKNKEIKSNQLWELSKMLEKITKRRWIVSLSSKNGKETLKKIEMDETQELIEKISKESSIKKILEIIPSSKVTSIVKMEKK